MTDNMAKIKQKEHLNQLFHIFLTICEAVEGYESKATGVLDHHLKLQLQNISRTRKVVVISELAQFCKVVYVVFFTRNKSYCLIFMFIEMNQT